MPIAKNAIARSEVARSASRVTPFADNPARQVMCAMRNAAQRRADAEATFRLHQEQMVAQVAQRIERERAELDELRRQRRRRIRTTFVAQFPGRPLNVALLPARATEPLHRYIETGNNHDFRRGFAELALTDEQHARIEENRATARAAAMAERQIPSDEEFRRAFFAANPRMVDGDLVHGLPEDN